MTENICDYHSCDSKAYRFFLCGHFCNEHNWYLRKNAKRDIPNNLDEWMESFM